MKKKNNNICYFKNFLYKAVLFLCKTIKGYTRYSLCEWKTNRFMEELCSWKYIVKSNIQETKNQSKFSASCNEKSIYAISLLRNIKKLFSRVNVVSPLNWGFKNAPYTVCSRSSDPFYIVSCSIKIKKITTSWTHSMLTS